MLHLCLLVCERQKVAGGVSFGLLYCGIWSRAGKWCRQLKRSPPSRFAESVMVMEARSVNAALRNVNAERDVIARGGSRKSATYGTYL